MTNLLKIYKQLDDNKGRGRRPTHNLDILRTSVVFTHSTLEDYLRNILTIKLPTSDAITLNSIPLIGTSENGRKTKFDLGDLVAHKELKVEKVIEISVKEYLSCVSFNDTNDISAHLKKISINLTPEITELLPTLNEFIKRRHNIVHNADRELEIRRGNHTIKSINYNKVLKWQKTLDLFVNKINIQL
ncbi:HEPN domain-containing protein [Flavobacterium sp. LAR06]|uniref:HEPN domain-containing protein n=1 Tax=Flavobacterium sp. LAR06 TaxID=3064897 RepID=UPI0035C09D56